MEALGSGMTPKYVRSRRPASSMTIVVGQQLTP
jgi:hypothetical protein